MSKFQVIAALVVAVIIMGSAMLGFSSGKEKGGYKAGVTRIHEAITQEEEWLNTSRPLTPEDLKGRIILLDFWTYCCINCIHTIPDLQYLEKKFGKDLTVIGVHSAKFANEKLTQNIRDAILRYDIEHPVVNDADFHIWQSFGVRAWPTLVLINPLGHIEEMYSGEGHRETLEHEIEQLRKEYQEVLNSDPLPLEPEEDKHLRGVLYFPGKLEWAEDVDGSPMLFISDSSHHRILGVRPDTGRIALTIGTGEEGLQDGSFDQASFNTPQGLLWDKDGLLYVADTENHVLRKIDLKEQTVETIAGTGRQGHQRTARYAPALETPLASPWDLAFYPSFDDIAIAMAGTHQLWVYNIRTKSVTVLAGNGRESIDDGPYPLNSLSQPSGLAVWRDTLYFVDSETSSLRKYEDGEITTLIGTGLFDFGFEDGKQGTALMQHAIGVEADKDGVYIADSYNHALRFYDPDTGKLSTLAGDGKRGMQKGELELARFNEPNDIVKGDDKFYIADTNNHRIQVFDPAKETVTTLPIMPAEPEMETLQPVDFLPNVKESGEKPIAAGKELTVRLQFAEGWKLNEAGPSFLALFEGAGEDATLLRTFDREQLSMGSIALPPLSEGKDYRLQGTLYYCEDVEGAQCLIESRDWLLQPEKEGSTELKIELGAVASKE